MAKVTNSESGIPKKTKRDRSPNYPAISLSEAVSLSEKVWSEYKRHPVPIGNLHKHWGLAPHGSAGNLRTAALRAYGLLDFTGTGKSRSGSLSSVGERIVRDAPDRGKLLQEAALSPAIFSELWDRYKDDGIPPDDLIQQYLEWDRPEVKFNSDAIPTVIANFRESIEFAKLLSDDILDADGEEGAEARSSNANAISIGDFVQWESGGQLKFSEPLMVSGISGDSEWAFVEGSGTGLPIGELKVVKKAEKSVPKLAPPNPFFREPVPDGPIFTLDLPRDNRVEVRLRSKLTPSEFKRFIKAFRMSAFGLVDGEIDENEEPDGV